MVNMWAQMGLDDEFLGLGEGTKSIETGINRCLVKPELLSFVVSDNIR